MSLAYLLSALSVAAVIYIPLLLIHRHYRREDAHQSNVVSFPYRDANVIQLPRKGGAA